MCVVRSTSEQTHNAPITYAHIKHMGSISPGSGNSHTTELFTNNMQPHNHEKAYMQMQCILVHYDKTCRQAAGKRFFKVIQLTGAVFYKKQS